MSILWAVLLGLAIGSVLGGLGGGGAILTVPALVYVIGQPAQEATTSSLVIVGLTALVGVASYVSSRRVSWKIGVGFSVAGVPAAYAGSYLNQRVNEHYLLLGFSVLMVLAAAAMASGRSRRTTEPDDEQPPPGALRGAVAAASPGGRAGSAPETQRGAVLTASDAEAEPTSRRQPSLVGIVLAGLAVGFLTGFFGVGGGFVIVPALVLVLGLPMQQAIGTSLLIVAANSATSLVARAGVAHFEWAVIAPFTAAAMLATLAGKRVTDRLPAQELKRDFALLLVLVAGYTAWHSVAQIRDESAARSSGAASSTTLHHPNS